MKKPLILIGGGGHCKSCIDIIEMDDRYEIIGIIDAPKMVGDWILGYEIIGSDDDIQSFAEKGCSFFITLGQIKSPARRIEIFKDLKKLSADVPSFISQKAYISRHAKIGTGTIIHHNAVINAAAEVGDLCVINTAAVVEHDVKVGNYCHVSTSVMVNGGVTVGDGTFIGSNASIKDNIEIGDGSFVGFHCRVMTNLAPGTKVIR